MGYPNGTGAPSYPELDRRISALERSNAAADARFEAYADRVDALIDDVREMMDRTITVQAVAIRVDADAKRRDDQYLRLERHIAELAKDRETDVRATGAHEIAKLEKALAEKTASAQHYTRWVIGTVTTTALGAVVATITYLLTH